MQYTLSILLVLLFSLSGGAQERERAERFKNKIDFGFNMTSVISSFSGNGNFLEAEDLPLLIRFRTKKSCLRLAVGASGQTTEFFDNITGAFRETSENKYFGRVGFEYDLLQEGKWDMYLGLDFLGSYLTDKVLVNSDNTLSQRIFGAGVSPFAGIKYYLGSRVYLGSEANLAFLYQSRRNTEYNTFTGERIVVNTEGEQFALNPPLFLYVNYKL